MFSLRRVGVVVGSADGFRPEMGRVGCDGTGAGPVRKPGLVGPKLVRRSDRERGERNPLFMVLLLLSARLGRNIPAAGPFDTPATGMG